LTDDGILAWMSHRWLRHCLTAIGTALEAAPTNPQKSIEYSYDSGVFCFVLFYLTQSPPIMSMACSLGILGWDPRIHQPSEARASHIPSKCTCTKIRGRKLE
jgi:hypothetical protein